ncbi:SDR family NAD(P)-dependent oxidoreductase [Streptomyces sp. 769]|uniref:SDR family NAD(P)-dependent oxidoreductase n=1 Tax=Streptomyces sp. 769 TaxID=1262452 RepID=UPI00057C542D|nr:SDR family NAD(P)-dependent oxidoreductase [Streptomyces sp. 769]AJC53468.1 oxidoreductase [Streptomyces sp. 769]
MKTYVITGGTDGIGKALAFRYLRQGEEVVVVGRSAEKGTAWLAAAREQGAAERAHFVPADLGSVAENRAVIDVLRASFGKLDALVLCARHFRTTRLVTDEGFENTFAHFYLSRFLLSHGLVELLEAADAPVILNVAGPGGTGEIAWEDLQLARAYDGQRALAQGGRLNDLLGVGFADAWPAARTRYVLVNPGTVNTSFSGQYTPAVQAQVDAIRRSAQPVEEAVRPLAAVLDDPPQAPLSALVQGAPLRVDGPGFEVASARRLRRDTELLLGGA